MTTEQLEHDLKALAEPRADDEPLRLAIRATLVEELRREPKPRRRSRVAVGFAAFAAATVAASIIALIGTGGSGGPSSANAAVLAHVARAMSPPANLIVHVKETGVQPDGTPVSAEWWQETNPPYAIRMIKGPSDQLHEVAGDGTLTDPVETVRAELTAGTANVAGTATINGQSLYKIELPTGVVGYFDKTDYRPVYLDNPQRDGTVVRTHVLTYEELPLTAENEKLLTLTAQHPDARPGTIAAPTK